MAVVQAAQLEARTEALLAQVRRPIDTSAGPVTLAASIGIARVRPGERLAQVLQRADTDLRTQKRSPHLRVL